MNRINKKYRLTRRQGGKLENKKLLSNQPIISEKEKNIILNEFNNTKREYAKNKTIKELFEEIVERSGNKVAIVSNGQYLTYKELNNRANQLGNLLLKKGVTNNNIVSILCDRSADTIIGMLAVIKSGASYLPIDEDYPKSRIEYMLEDSKSKILLFKKHQLDKVNIEKTNIDLIDLSSEEINKENNTNLKNINSPEDLAYVIYTSGSTGKPKGVCLENRGLVKIVNNPNYIKIHNKDRILQSGSLSFDASVFQLWLALLNGIPLHIEDKSLIIDDSALETYIRKNKITVMIMPTPLFNQYSENNVELFENLRCLIVGGDVLSSKQVSKITRVYKNLKIINGYGPTENSVISTAYEIQGDWDENIAIPIGSPVSNSTAYIMDKNNNLLPIGVTGELCVGGDGLARGYLNREELNKEKFVENPYVKGERIYKTGDLARWLPDGNIHFVGRIDHQVKIRGFRIELEEIEAQLLKYPKLKQAAVADKEDENGNKYLCGYVISEEKISSRELKDFLKRELPSYMIPSYIMQLKDMPINCNGKVDRKALPVPDLSLSDVEFISPRNEMEQKLAEIWCELFNMKKISIKDNFFDLGGHSLMSVNLVSRIHKEIKLKTTASDIFNMPSIEELAQHLNSLVLDNKDNYELEFKDIEEVAKADYYEASAVQKRMYAVNQMDRNSTNYNLPFAYLIKGNFDRGRFEKAICELINRHEALRTSFQVIDGEIFQKVHTSINFKVKCVRINGNFQEDKVEVDKFVKPFDLSNAPLIRALVIEFLDASVLMIDMHHIISDGVSVGIIVEELSSIYNKEKLNKLKIQYKDFSNWQNKLYKNGLLGSQEKYWLDNFKGELPVLNMPSDYKRVSTEKFEGATIDFEIDITLTNEINKTLKSLGITKFMFYLAAYNVLLYKYTGQDDLVIGTPAAGRTHEDLKGTVGMFVNTLPLRSIIRENMSFKEFLNEVKSNSLKAFENQDYDLKNLVEKLNIKNSSLFDVVFSFQNVAIDALNFRNTEISTYKLKNNVSKFDISMILEEDKEKIYGKLEYRTALYCKETIENFAKHYVSVIKEVIKDLDNPINKVDIVSEEEKDIILNKFNNTKREYAKNKTVSELFEEIAERSQNKIAIVSNGQNLTYKELNERANQLGNLLIKRGITKNSIVPILCDRSVDTIIGMLAVIKSGAAYLPIDEDYPEARIKYMLQDSNSKILLIKKHQLDKVNLEKTNIELIDLSNENIHIENKENLNNRNTSSDLAYVIYTSGSTGNPKGVCIENKGLLKLVNNPDYIDIIEKDKILQSGSLSFDASVFQIWIALLNGVTLHLENKALIINDAELEAYINENKITVMLMPTPLFNQYGQNNIGLFKSLRCLIVGGDVLSSKQVSKVKKAYKDLKILNAYGPTENSVISTVYEVKGEWDENMALPIGVPISNSTAYIMDKNNNLLPIGVAGELCVGGDGIARGYLNRKELTKEKFMENPYVKGERIYKTGDLAKWLPDGNIDFLGRIDHQVKINGFRIELEEIEAQLLKYSKLKEAAVADKEDENGNKYLCGYVISEDKISSKELKDFLKRELPNYMIPSRIMQLDNMPINCNGKIDRKALPIPDLSQSDVEFIEPRNEMEQKLADIWCELFNIKKISIKDNFFELGGHSLKAVNLVGKIHKEVKLKITTTDIFNMPSIEELANYLNNISIDNKEDYAAIEKVDEVDFYEASAVQKRLYAVNQLDIDGTNYNLPIAYLIKGNFDKCVFEKAICELINRHEALRTSFHVIDGEVFQKVHNIVDFKVQYLKINEYFEEDKVKVDKFIKPFDLSNAPLIRAFIIEFFDLSVLMIDMHHIISDGVSVGIIIKELSSLYNKEKVDNLKIQYKDYSNWHNKLYKNGLLETQEKYWLDKFKGELPVLNMPSDYKKVSNENAEGATIDFEIDKALTCEINEALSSLSITKFMFYLAAYNVLLYKYTGQEDLVIGTPAAGRTHEDLKDTVGMFVNTLPIRSNISENMSFKELLNEVKSNSLMAFENQDYDLKNLVEKLNIKNSSLFDVVFSFQNVAIEDLSFRNTEISTYKLKNNVSKFNISMILEENNEKILGMVEYRTTLYNKVTIENFAKYYINILRKVLNDLDTPIEKIDILSEEEKAVIFNKFNNTKREYAKNKTVSNLFEEIVENAHNEIAVVSNGTEITYGKLNEKANQLANLLRKKGVTKNSIVPILCDRSVDTIIGMLAIIKSGAAYLPIDEDYPKSRIIYMLEDSNSKILLFKKHQLHKVDLEKANIGLIDINNEEMLKENKQNLKNISSPEDLAYVIYTSGSTGNPKGVCIENNALVKLVNNPNYIEIQENDKILQSGSLSFDASVFQIWIALLNGISLHLEDKTLIINDSALETYINENKITIMLMPTPLFNQYSQNNIGLFKNLRCLIVGGDVLSSKQVSKTKKAYKDLKIINAYGPTENTVISTVYEVKGEWDENKSVPIGAPISNSTAYIMDKNHNLLPIGLAGELCVGGEGIARGYLNREELTKEKFIENPYVQGERIYKTGDLAKWLPDGNIDFLGRIDHQVKINGFRIELEEIEAQILKYSKVKEAAVVDKEDENGNKYLCGYVVSEEKIYAKELKAFLKKELPNYMIPSYIMQLENMPNNSNGKVDRKKLPIPNLSILAEEYIAPRNEIEYKISVVWSEVLGINKVSIDSNFFEIGGNSLKAISIVSKLSKEFTIAINDLFNYPTILELAANIKSMKENSLLRMEEVQKEVAVTELKEEYDNINGIPQAIKPLYDSYIDEIEKYVNFDLNNETSYKNILLTGATGYVGINLLKELILNTDSTIHLLLRGKTIIEAEKRIIQKTDFYFGQEFYPKFKHRIKLLLGNISENNLGLDDNTYEKLSLEIDCIINSAGNVKHYGKYEDFYNVNVLGTKHLLCFAEKGFRKSFNQISTMSVAYGTIPDTNLVLFSESNIDIGQECDNVYVRSKLEAEKLVEAAGKNSLNTKIFRVGNVTFNYATGSFQENINENGFYQNIKSFIKLNCIPKIKGDTLDFCYVDQLSKAIILLFNKNSFNNQVFHIENPKKISTSDLARVLKIWYEKVELISMNDFLSYISLKRENEELREYIDNIMVHFGLLENNNSTTFITVNERTNAILHKLGFEWSKLDEEAVKRMLEYCKKVKFL